MNPPGGPPLAFGGDWTKRKLDAVEEYLNAYTTALKDQPFQLYYIDAFAGTGDVEIATEDKEGRELIRGSARRALAVRNRRFDRVVLVEKDPELYARLASLKTEHQGRDISIRNEDANAAIGRLGSDWRRRRGVLFLDPFGTQVNWTTITAIERTKALDTWILFPVGAIGRLLPRSRKPEDVTPRWAERLTQVYGGGFWRALYDPSQQLPLFGSRQERREPGVSGLTNIYEQQLRALFGTRFVGSATLHGPNSAPLFELFFVVGNPQGVKVAKKIAGHILDNI